NASYFSGHKRRIDFNNMFARQTEAICFTTEDEIYLSAEDVDFFPAAVYKMNIAQWISVPSAISEIINETDRYRLFYDSLSGYLSIEILSDRLDVKSAHICVYDISGRNLLNESVKVKQNSNKIYLGRLNRGIYIVRLSTNHFTFADKILID
ncbi:MAG: T9SS type A sorting domain-containing protein, partial [Bacteroidales bacterium]|nr:T9SS type A sorting domain-containing protein [Bacteroidales bacterium]